MPNDLERRIARYLVDRAGRTGQSDGSAPAPADEIARDVLGLSGASAEIIAGQIDRLVGPSPQLIERVGAGWTVANAGAVPETPGCSGPPPGSVAVVVADVPRGSFRPSRLALLTDTWGAVLVWPGDSPRDVRRAARERAILVTGGRAEASAIAAWLRPESVRGVFLLRRLLRRAGLEVPRSLASRKRDPDETEPEARCREAFGTVSGLLERLASDRIESWEDVHTWLESRPDFDFSGRAFDRATLESLPAGPGVYRFYDPSDRLVYVGKSRRLRDRVSSYFRPSLKPSGRQARIAARAHRIDVQPEGSDLAAQVREASDIRTRKPYLNSQRSVRERPVDSAWRGDRVIVLPSRAARGSDVLFVRGGQVVDRRKMRAGPTSLGSAVELLARYFFEPERVKAPPPDGSSTGSEPIRRAPGENRGISRRSAEEAGRLLATWSRKKKDDILSFDPTESPDPDDAARRLLAYLEAEPGEGLVFIR